MSCDELIREAISQGRRAFGEEAELWVAHLTDGDGEGWALLVRDPSAASLRYAVAFSQPQLPDLVVEIQQSPTFVTDKEAYHAEPA